MSAVREAQTDRRQRRQGDLFQGRSQHHELHRREYLFRFVVPNFFFHVTTAYDILRHKGVEIGKMDYLGPMPMQPAA
jgi:hypothetical protein